MSTQRPDGTDAGWTTPDFDFTMPGRLADVVMKGGVTSGIVYPYAICELARSFSFVNIAGTSAGAIAAGLTAAAEYRRRTDRQNPSAGFELLAELPKKLARPGAFLEIFRADPGTRPLLAAVLAAMRAGKFGIGTLVGVCRTFPFSALVGGLLGLGLALLLVGLPAGGWLAWLRWGVVALVGIILGVAIMLFLRMKRALAALPSNGFGLCGGLAAGPGDELPSLSRWLYELIQEAAGLPKNQPLTFGQLWSARHPDPELAALIDDLPGHVAGDSREKEDREPPKHINFEAIATALTHGRPYRFPMSTVWKRFYFDPDELDGVLPAEVVACLRNAARKPGKRTVSRDRHEAGDRVELFGFPAPEDVPVFVAVRLSLSFPGLLSAVPLYSVRYGQKVVDQTRIADRVWFSDGGITSNFPIHSFDGLIPRWPTFGINLAAAPPGAARSEDERKNVFFPRSNKAGLQETWAEDPAHGPNETKKFAGLIFGSMQSWFDNAFLRLPGYRQRVATVWQFEGEGGLNLEMPCKVVRSLAFRGLEAGRLLRERFVSSPQEAKFMSWTDHRWVRLLAISQALSDMRTSIRRALLQPHPGDAPARDLVAGAGRDFESYALDKESLAQVDEFLEELSRFAEGRPLNLENPNPRITIGVRPEIH
ncbi:MAG: patatin-like phospholipase family protein [Gemmatimonadetes bacterium]|nr:patatin-like phospholipase family protein [Gemmatimonadota bacterium]